MLPASEVLDLYRAERAALDMPSDPFPAFAEWRADYEAEYRKNHVVNYKKVDVKEAMVEADALVAEAEAELDFINDEEEMQMSETNVSGVVGSTPATPAVDLDAQAALDAKREAKNAKRRAQRAAAAKPAKAKAKAKAPAKARVARKDNKTAQAQAIFTKMYGKKERKDVIAAFIEKVGLTANGASTYYQKLKAAV